MYHCPTCKTLVEEGTNVCPCCGRDLDDRSAAMLVKAPLLERFLASLIDGVVTVLLAIPAIICYMRGVVLMDNYSYRYTYSYSDNSISEPAIYLFFAFVLYVILAGMYAFIKDGLGEGQSLGKRVMGLKVVRVEDCSNCTIGLSALRTLVGTLVGLLPCIGNFIEPIMVLATDDGRRLADKAAGTMVIRA